MPLHPLYGHEAVRRRLGASLAARRLPQSLLLEGPRGVGKQRLALWLAQGLLCEAREENATTEEGCGTCASCRQVLNLAHPDLHWIVPLELVKKGGDADRQVEVVQEAIAEEMAARREHPLYEPPGGMASHSIAAVRLLLRQLALTPVRGRRKVFVIGDAERLVPQQGAEAAANALLKALEEPPHDTSFILTTSDADALLPTIVSRVVRVRVTRNLDSVVTSFIQNECPQLKTGQELDKTLAVTDGCIGRLFALGNVREGGDGGAFQAALRGDRVARYSFALAQRPFEARGGFTGMLDDLLDRMRAEARAGAAGDLEKVVAAIARLMEARGMAQGNVNPQLLAAVLADDVAVRNH